MPVVTIKHALECWSGHDYSPTYKQQITGPYLMSQISELTNLIKLDVFAEPYPWK